MGRAQAAAGEVGARPVFADWFLAARARIALGAGRILEALDLAEQATTAAQEVDNLSAEAYARLPRQPENMPETPGIHSEVSD